MINVSRKITADVLVIGGGGAACTAAVAAARGGAKVVMVSKGKVGNSGNTIMIGGSYGMDAVSYTHLIKLYLRLRWGFLGHGVNLPGKSGRKVSSACYKIAQKFYGFN